MVFNKYILIKTEFEGIHKWTKAPKEVSFLKYPHRHKFLVEAQIEVKGDDRELEFFIVKAFIDNRIDHMEDIRPIGWSCEMMATFILEELEGAYGPDRKIWVSVSEDGENAGIVNNFPNTPADFEKKNAEIKDYNHIQKLIEAAKNGDEDAQAEITKMLESILDIDCECGDCKYDKKDHE